MLLRLLNLRAVNIAELILSNGEDSAEAILFRNRVVTLWRVARTGGSCCRRAAGAWWSSVAAGPHFLGEQSSFFVAAYLGIVRPDLPPPFSDRSLSQHLFGNCLEHRHEERLYFKSLPRPGATVG